MYKKGDKVKIGNCSLLVGKYQYPNGATGTVIKVKKKNADRYTLITVDYTSLQKELVQGEFRLNELFKE